MTNKEIQIHEWAETRSYNDLNGFEKEIVDEYFMQQEYDALHELSRDAGPVLIEDLTTAKPNPTSVAILTDAVSKQTGRMKHIALWQKKLPLYWTAAACLLAFLVSYFLFSNPNTPETVTQDRTIIQKVYDTLYIDKPIITEVVKSIYVPVSSHSAPVIQTSFVPDESEYVQEVAPTPSKDGIVRSFGNSGVDPNALEQFKVQM